MSTSPIRSRHPTIAPPRLAEGGGTDYERRLLSSARLDAAPATSADRVYVALRAAGSAAALSAAPGRDAGAANATSLARPWAIGVIGAGVIGALIASHWPERSARSTTSHASNDAAPSITAAPVAAAAADFAGPSAAPSPGVDAKTASEAKAAATAARRTRARTSEVQKRVSSRPAAASTRDLSRPVDLAAEIRAIETVQTLLAWGQAEQASRSLGAYRSRFPRGELTLEADVLEVDVALARGDQIKARALARALLGRPEAGRYAARLSALLDADGSNSTAR